MITHVMIELLFLILFIISIPFIQYLGAKYVAFCAWLLGLDE